MRQYHHFVFELSHWNDVKRPYHLTSGSRKKCSTTERWHCSRFCLTIICAALSWTLSQLDFYTIFQMKFFRLLLLLRPYLSVSTNSLSLDSLLGFFCCGVCLRYSKASHRYISRGQIWTIFMSLSPARQPASSMIHKKIHRLVLLEEATNKTIFLRLHSNRYNSVDEIAVSQYRYFSPRFSPEGISRTGLPTKK